MRSESSSIPTGSVPGIRLASDENALRALPGGKRKGAVTNPGRRSNSGRKARRATSNPDTTDPRKKLTARAASAPRRSHEPLAGRRARLVHVAPATAASPTGRSAVFQPEIASQKAKSSAPRDAAALARRGGLSPSRALKDELRRRYRAPDWTRNHRIHVRGGRSAQAIGDGGDTSGRPFASERCLAFDTHAQLPYRRSPANAAQPAVCFSRR